MQKHPEMWTYLQPLLDLAPLKSDVPHLKVNANVFGLVQQRFCIVPLSDPSSGSPPLDDEDVNFNADDQDQVSVAGDARTTFEHVFGSVAKALFTEQILDACEFSHSYLL